MSTTAQTYYSQARNELILRIRLREQVLNYFLVAAGVLLGIAISDINGVGSTVALVIPFIGLGTSILITSHTMVITSIAKYSWHLEPAINKCREENLKKLLRDNKDPDEDVSTKKFQDKLDQFILDTELTPWDRSGAYSQQGLWSSWQRLVGNNVVILGPAILALFLGWMHSGILDSQRDRLATELSTENIVREIRSAGGSDETLMNILDKQSRGSEKIDHVENEIRIHNILFYSGLLITIFIMAILTYGHIDRKKWITELKMEHEKRVAKK